MGLKNKIYLAIVWITNEKIGEMERIITFKLQRNPQL